MCCFERRKYPAWIVLIMSSLAAIAGIVMIIFARNVHENALLDKAQTVDEVDSKVDLERLRELVFIGLVAFSSICILAGLLGICLFWIKNRCCAVIYGILLFPTWIVVVVVGGAAVWASTASSDVLEEEC